MSPIHDRRRNDAHHLPCPCLARTSRFVPPRGELRSLHSARFSVGSLTRSLVIPAIRLFFLLQHERTTCCSRDRLCRLFVPCYRAQLVLRVRHESSEQHLVVLPLLCPPPSPLSPLTDRHRVLSFFLFSRSWRTIAAVSVVPSSLVLAHSARAARTPREVCILYILPSCA